MAVVCWGCTLSVTRGRLAVVCKGPMCTLSATLGRLSDVRGVCVNYVSYFRKVGGCLQDVRNLLVIWGRVAIVCSGCVICQVLATHGWLSAGVCTLSVTLGRLADVCGVSVNSVSYFRKLGGCLQGVCNIVFISDRLLVACSGFVI